MNISEFKNAVLKMVEISSLVTDNNLENSRLEKNSIDNTKYHSLINPQIRDFRQQFGASPEKYLEKLLENFIEKMNVTENYEVHSFRYFGRVLHSYCWAAIILKDPSITQLKVTYFPQLYILVNRYGIRFGFCYGVNVKTNFVETIKSDPELRNQILKLVSDPNNLKLYSEIGPEKEPNSNNILSTKEKTDLNTKWSSEVSLIKNYSKPNLSDNIESLITNTFESVFPLFDSISRNVPLKRETPMKQPERFEIFDLLRSKKQIILYGPPGTGKTFEAQRFAVDFLSRGSTMLHMKIANTMEKETSLHGSDKM